MASVSGAASSLLVIKIPRNRAGSSRRVLDCNFWKCTPPPRSYLVWSHLWLKVSRCLFQCKQFIIKVQRANIRAASSGRQPPPLVIPPLFNHIKGSCFCTFCHFAKSTFLIPLKYLVIWAVWGEQKLVNAGFHFVIISSWFHYNDFISLGCRNYP